MSEKTTDNKFPYTCTSSLRPQMLAKAASVPPATSRNSATGAAACENHSKRKEHCNAYEGAYNY